MSQDKVVTPRESACLPRLNWIARSLSMMPVQSLRRQHIKRMHGSVRRALSHCGCGDVSANDTLANRPLIYGLLEPVEVVREALLSTECRMAPVLWILLIPNGGLFSWCEVIELTDPKFLSPFFEPPAMRGIWSKEVWDTMGKNELRFKVLSKTNSVNGDVFAQTRSSVIREIMSGHKNISHLNFSCDSEWVESLGAMKHELFDLGECDVDFLRTRYIPRWRQCGDMAYCAFNTYTITRKVS